MQVKQIRGFLDDTAYCVTNTGKKYHNPRCPYCNGKETHEITLEQIKIREIDPCICVTRGFGANTKRPAIDSTYMTAYVDESWRPVEWDENGNKGHVGNYSYVIYKGRVEEDEDHISLSDAMILCKGVDYCAINKGHIEFLTEAAIGKVLIRLLYDYGFKKNVIIYTDNKSVVYAWNRSYENSELARQFESVEVRHIPRGQNRHADHLGRKQVFLCLPSDKYKEIVNTCKAVDCGGVIA